MLIKYNNKLYLNTVATELMCFYKYSKNVYIYIYDMIIKSNNIIKYNEIATAET